MDITTYSGGPSRVSIVWKLVRNANMLEALWPYRRPTEAEALGRGGVRDTWPSSVTRPPGVSDVC